MAWTNDPNSEELQSPQWGTNSLQQVAADRLRLQKEKEASDLEATGKLAGTLTGIVGAIVGTIAGGSPGMGYKIGSALGQAVGGKDPSKLTSPLEGLFGEATKKKIPKFGLDDVSDTAEVGGTLGSSGVEAAGLLEGAESIAGTVA